jgi:hypothetical protein
MSRVFGCLVALLGTPVLAAAQSPPLALVEPVGGDTGTGQGAGSSEPGVAVAFVRDLAHDYKNFLSTETALWLGVGGGAAWAVHAADQSIADSVQRNPPSLPGGNYWGSQGVQIPLAIAWWIAGAAAGSSTQATVGRDLLRGQLLEVGYQYGIKYATDRTRPNGDPRSLPSGHATTSFTTAMVLQEHFGWKVGLPAFVAAAYTGVSRVTDNQHWASDVVFGAALGMAAGRTVTLHLRDTRFTVSPVAVPRGVALNVVARRPF